MARLIFLLSARPHEPFATAFLPFRVAVPLKRVRDQGVTQLSFSDAQIQLI
jgi:hypothetical protein